MLNTLTYVLVFLGSALMVYNIYKYIKFALQLRSEGGWESELRTLRIPTVLLIMFLAGYLIVGLFGKPDIVISGILFGGSVFVFVMVNLLDNVVAKVQENERLEAKLQAAEASNRAKTSFLSGMSHEIRTPMNAIIGLTNIALHDDTLSPQTREQLEKIDASADHLLALINDILDMSRIESGKLELKDEEFCLCDVVDQVNVIIKGQCDDKGLTYLFDGINDGDCNYIGDATKINQVLINILGNAVKFTNAPGTVSLKVQRAARFNGMCTLRFTISDTGIGMDKEFIPRIFNAFSQEDGSNTSKYGGTGLGMAITRSLVEYMNGNISVTSQKGAGSIFTVNITLKEAEKVKEEAVEVPETEAAAVSIEGLRVLLAEDVEINAEILGELLDMEGVLSDRAENGQQAVEMFKASAENYYNAVLMDIRMPVMDGLAATEAIRALGRPDAKTVPVIAMTANAFEEDVQRSLQAGMNAHLSKPIEPDILYATIGRLAGKQEEK